MKEFIENNITLNEQELRNIFTNILNLKYNEEEIIDFLLALNNKSDISQELSILRSLLINQAIKIEGHQDAVDLCGTGGDNLNYFNISTATTFVVAAAGIKVAKHGNRGVSSLSGSSDVLTALGIDIMSDPNKSAQSLKEINLAFLFAPIYHPILKNIAPIRKKIGKRTIFNLLGPLLNPALIDTQLIGIYDFNLAQTYCKILAEAGSKRVMIVQGANKADEITTVGKAKICELKNNEISLYEFDPKEYGFSYCKNEKLVGKDPEYNAKAIIDLLNGKKSAFYDTVIINSAFVILMKNKRKNLQEAIEFAKSLVDDGLALAKLNELKDF